MSRRRATTARPRAKSLESEPEKRRAILHAAVRAFAEKGYHGCRIADVAREAGVAHGLAYHYFRDKDELLESVFDEQWTIFIQDPRHLLGSGHGGRPPGRRPPLRGGRLPHRSRGGEGADPGGGAPPPLAAGRQHPPHVRDRAEAPRRAGPARPGGGRPAAGPGPGGGGNAVALSVERV